MSNRESDREPPALPDDATLTSGSATDDSHAKVEGDALTELRQQTELPFRLRYPLDERIGKGGMGEVFRAKDRILQRDVAIKLLLPGRENTVAFHRFVRESQITAQLAHPNIVPIHAIEVAEQGRPALVMKHLDGITFKQYIEECREALDSTSADISRHSRRTRIEHFLRVCDAVDYAHHRSVIHRDLKPANLMLGRHHEVYVMDWGIARVLGEPDDDAPTEERVTDTSGLTTGAGAFIGTPMYLAPEQSEASEQPIGPAADQYALGLCLQELITLAAPREGKTAMDLLDAAQVGERAPLVAPRGESPIPPGLKALIRKATARAVTDRYASVDELAIDLRHWQANEELAAYPDNFARRMWRSIQHHPTRAMSFVLILLLIAATTTTYSLVETVRTQDEAAVRTSILTGIVSDLSAHMLTAEQKTSILEVMLESIAVEVESRFRYASTPARLSTPSQLKGPDVTRVDRYAQKVSFLRSVAVRAPNANAAACDATEGRMKGIDAAFRALFMRPVRRIPGAIEPMEEANLIRATSRIHYAYIGFESGLLVNYPGNTIYPKGYDPRARPWYRRALEQPGISTGRPYPDASGSGYLLACNRAIHAQDGSILGVAGIDVSLDLVLDLLEFPCEYPVQSTILVDATDSTHGIVATSADRGGGASIGLHDNQEKSLTPFRLNELSERFHESEVNGVIIVDESLYVFCRFERLGWYLVVQFRTDDVLG